MTMLMMRTTRQRWYLGVGLATLLMGAGGLRAEPILVRLEGNVSLASIPFAIFTVLEDSVLPDDPIDAYYVYDTDTPDSNPDLQIVEYLYPESPFGISMRAGDFTSGRDRGLYMFSNPVVAPEFDRSMGHHRTTPSHLETQGQLCGPGHKGHIELLTIRLELYLGHCVSVWIFSEFP